MKDFDYYSINPLPYPSKGKFTTVYGYRKGKLVFEHPYNIYVQTDPDRDITIERDFDQVAYREAMDAYNTEARKLNEEFMTDLFEEFGVQNNPKRHRAYDLAYEYGHSAGYPEIYSHFCDLVDLIKD